MKHENYSLGYDLLRIHARFLHRLVHRCITVSGLANIPQNKALIFAPNHQNALMDAMAVLLTVPHQPVWLARADIFGNSFINKILHFLKISPVYRIRDGKDNLAKNDEVFDLALRVLKNKRALAVFPEGMHTFRRQSASHKKAIPRIAFMAAERENFAWDIAIVPVGIFYSHYYHLHRRLLVQFGKPILINDYAAAFAENENTAMLALRDELKRRIFSLTLNIASSEHYESIFTLTDIDCHNHPPKHAVDEVKQRQKIADQMQRYEETHAQEAVQLFIEAKNYRQLLAQHHLTDATLAQTHSCVTVIAQSILALIALPLFLYGYINFFVGFVAPSLLVRRKIRDRAFWATTAYGIWVLTVPLMALLQTGIVWWATGCLGWAAAYFLTLPLMGKAALFVNDFYSRLRQQIKLCLRKDLNQQLQQMRESLSQKISNHTS
jgi:1-acyl-sn-glycerol-3-phosphate acyltransferase